MSAHLITHPGCLDHRLDGHPERPERLQAILSRLEASGLAQDLTRSEAREVTDEELVRAHPRDFIDFIEELAPESGWSRIDVDTYMSPGSLRAARLAAGACAEAVARVLKGESQRVFCAVRPPGHHTELREAMGFCIFNNMAVAAEAALADSEVERIAILDFDVHHCNGTVDIFRERDEVLICSTFQYPFYPNRYLDYSNPHVITGPLYAGSGSHEFRTMVEMTWLPAIEAHRPDLILISAGFDAHRDDPLGELNLGDEDYIWITQFAVDAANRFSKGRIVSTLEGGYDLESLARSAHLHVEELAK